MKDFWEWFDSMRGNISVRAVERMGGAPQGRISNVYHKKEPSALVCETIAKALGIDISVVFHRAGIIKKDEVKTTDQMINEIYEAYRSGVLYIDKPMEQPDNFDDITAELLDLFSKLDNDEKQAVIAFTRFQLKNE